eukprot:CAMPEP_0170492840 /NCGR_PEP_ID=MMETSP0208-20121228/12969_1 /TAXON_ID=197538 /ORGANISM="Strombidium inclinatum, Strain S3" /LENGTH=56 /DNA_ID=CAMNT_0010768659 /DNA_START=231 /DNA_END=398 /DNA_ORIENTATION=+
MDDEDWLQKESELQRREFAAKMAQEATDFKERLMEQKRVNAENKQISTEQAQSYVG